MGWCLVVAALGPLWLTAAARAAPWAALAPDPGDAFASASAPAPSPSQPALFLSEHPLVAMHSSLPQSALIPLDAPPPLDLLTFEAVEHVPPNALQPLHTLQPVLVTVRRLRTRPPTPSPPAPDQQLIRSGDIAVVPLPTGIRPFQGFSRPSHPEPPLPPPPPPTPPDAVVSPIDPSEIVVVNPEEEAGAGVAWPQPLPQPLTEAPPPAEGQEGQEQERPEVEGPGEEGAWGGEVGGGAQWPQEGSWHSPTSTTEACPSVAQQPPSAWNPTPEGGAGASDGAFHQETLAKDGSYAFQYETGDQSRGERGYLKTIPGAAAPVLVKEGFYTYSDASGAIYRVDYVADEGGFRMTTSPVRARRQPRAPPRPRHRS